MAAPFVYHSHHFNMPGQAKHIKQLDGLFFYVGEYDPRSCAARGINDPEKDGDADAVDDLGLGKVYDELAAALVKSLTALAFDLLASELVQIIPGENDRAFIARIHGFGV